NVPTACVTKSVVRLMPDWPQAPAVRVPSLAPVLYAAWIRVPEDKVVTRPPTAIDPTAAGASSTRSRASPTTVSDRMACGPAAVAAVELTAIVEPATLPRRPAAALPVTFRVPMLPARIVAPFSSPSVTAGRVPAAGVTGLSVTTRVPTATPPA